MWKYFYNLNDSDWIHGGQPSVLITFPLRLMTNASLGVWLPVRSPTAASISLRRREILKKMQSEHSKWNGKFGGWNVQNTNGTCSQLGPLCTRASQAENNDLAQASSRKQTVGAAGNRCLWLHASPFPSPGTSAPKAATLIQGMHLLTLGMGHRLGESGGTTSDVHNSPASKCLTLTDSSNSFFKWNKTAFHYFPLPLTDCKN